MNILIIQILLTITSLGYSLIPLIFDSNSTHMTNPLWVPHARFHVVWQVYSFVGFALLALWMIWFADFPQHLWVAAIMSAVAYGGFFVAVFARNLYGGATYDDNGVLPWRPPVLGRWFAFEVNITLFSSTVIILIMAVLGLMLPTGGHDQGVVTVLWSIMYVLFGLLMVTLVLFVGGFVVGRSKKSASNPEMATVKNEL